MRKSVVLFIFFAFFARAQSGDKPSQAMGKEETITQASGVEEGVDFAQQDPAMNDYYIKGPYLVYDCIGDYWVCTGKPEFDRCKHTRHERSEDYDPNLGCAYFTAFKSLEACQAYQLQMTSRGGSDRFCLHPEERKKRFDY